MQKKSKHKEGNKKIERLKSKRHSDNNTLNDCIEKYQVKVDSYRKIHILNNFVPEVVKLHRKMERVSISGVVPPIMVIEDEG